MLVEEAQLLAVRRSSSERSDGSGLPVWIALSISGGTTPAKLVWIPSSSGGAGRRRGGVPAAGHHLDDDPAPVAACATNRA